MPLYLEAGGDIERFWLLAPDEIKSVIEAYQSKVKHEQQFMAIALWQHAGWISNLFAKHPSGKTLPQYFPQLFDDIQENNEDDEVIEKQLAMNKAAFIAFANSRNNQIVEGDNNG